MSFSIGTGIAFDCPWQPYVSITVHAPTPLDDLDEAQLGAAAGLIFRAADVAYAIDPYGVPSWYAKALSRSVARKSAYHRLTFDVSYYDVTRQGPIHLARARAVHEAMRAVMWAAL